MSVTAREPTSVWLYLAIALLAAASLAYQILLMRFLAIVHWYPFAAMIVSLALLGHGVSGTVLAFVARWAHTRFHWLFACCACGFGLAAPLCFALAQRVPFNGLELVWDAGQLPRLALIYLLLALPFFLAATCFGLAFAARGERIPRLYAADLVGAGLGAVSAIVLLYALSSSNALRTVAGAGIAAGALALLDAGASRRQWVVPLLAVLVLGPLPSTWLTPRPNDYKGLARALTVSGARIDFERSGPLGLLTVVDNPIVPLRHTPGVSLTYTEEPPPQLALFVDADSLSAIPARRVDEAGFLAHDTAALPYALREHARVLVLGAGGGSAVLQALSLGARGVEVVELDPAVVALVRDRYGEYTGGLYADARVQVHIGDARSWLRGAGSDYDLIVFPLSDSAGGAGAGVLAAADSFLLTIEALRDAYARLSPGGLIAATHWEKEPPRDALKRFATSIAMLRAEGVADPGAQLVLIRGWQTSTMLIKRGAFGAAELAAIARFSETNGFDAAWHAGLDPALTNRFHRVETPWLADGARALLGSEASRFVAQYKFDLSPATDDQPFFHDFFRWSALPELWRLREHGGAALLDSGYLVLIACAVQALPLSLLLILAPLARLRRDAAQAPLWRPAIYFSSIGLAFLFVEIAALSRYTLLVGHPLIAATVVLGTMLVFAGLGSACGARWIGRRRAGFVVFGALVAVLLLSQALLPILTSQVAAWPTSARLALAVGTLAPLAFLMGLPFPLGLSRLAATAPALVPWAWGINGCASVLSALLALLLAIDFGYGVVLLAAAALYALAVLAWPQDGESKAAA